MYFHFAASIKLIYFFIIGSISTGILLTITIFGILAFSIESSISNLGYEI
jgi:hypothetical protein